MRLDARETEVSGRHALALEWEGREVVVIDDFDAAMAVTRAVEGGAGPLEVAEAVAAAFADPREVARAADMAGLLSMAMWEAFGIDLDGSHASETGGERVMDWEQDADRVRVTLLECYGLRWAEARRSLGYRELVSLVAMAPREAPMGQALFYRCAREPRSTKWNQREVEAFRKLRAHYALRGAERPGGEMASMSRRNAEAFAGIASGARRADG